MTLLLPLLAFLFGSLAGQARLPCADPAAARIDRRLEGDDPAAIRRRATAASSPIGFVKRVGEKAPRSPKEMGKLQQRLVQAGYRRDEALTIFFGIRLGFALAVFALFSTPILMSRT